MILWHIQSKQHVRQHRHSDKTQGILYRLMPNKTTFYESKKKKEKKLSKAIVGKLEFCIFFVNWKKVKGVK